MNTLGQTKTPWHLWVVGIVGLAWNAIGAANYIQVKRATAEFYEQQAEVLGVSADIVSSYMESYPFWANIAYGLAVWGAIAGAILLLLRRRHAQTAFLISIAGLIVNVGYQALSPIEGAGDMTQFHIFNAIIILSIIIQWYYARRMSAAGILR